MLFNKLEAWVTDASGEEKLTEYVRRKVENNTVECWVPSTTGANFGIKFKHADPVPKRPKYGLEFELCLDGDKVIEAYYVPSDLTEDPEYYEAKYTAKTIQRFEFGTLQLTDKEEHARLDDPRQFELNTIKLKFQWITGFVLIPQKPMNKKKSKCLDEDADDDDESIPDSGDAQPKYVHEQIAKKLAHNGSARLGPAIARDTTPSIKQGKMWDYRYADKDSVSFVFRYAPKEWLEDKGVIRSSAPLPNPEIYTIDGESTPLPQRDPTPLPSSLARQPKAEPDVVTPSLASSGAISVGLNDDFIRPSVVPSATSEPEAISMIHEDDTLPLPHGPSPPVVKPIPLKRLREPVPTSNIDVDALSSDDDIIILDVRPSKDVKRARIAQYELEFVKHEVEDMKPNAEPEDTKPKIEDVKPNIALGETSEDGLQRTRSRLKDRGKKLGEQLEARLEQDKSQVARTSDHLLALQLLRLADTYQTLVKDSLPLTSSSAAPSSSQLEAQGLEAWFRRLDHHVRDLGNGTDASEEDGLRLILELERLVRASEELSSNLLDSGTGGKGKKREVSAVETGLP